MTPRRFPKKVSVHSLGTPCARCTKPQQLCVCELLPVIENKIEVLVLQHPQELGEILSSVPLLAASLQNCTVRVGLSWPSLSRLVGAAVDPKKWGVLFLGTKRSSEREAGARSDLPRSELQGLIALDGNWRQAKALWWRNPWLLKLHRIVLDPRVRSLYGEARKEPRPESLSTLEAVAMALAQIEQDPAIFEDLTAPLRKLVERYHSCCDTEHPAQFKE